MSGYLTKPSLLCADIYVTYVTLPCISFALHALI